MLTGVMRIICSGLLGALLASCSSKTDPQICHGGCLCFRTPHDCPAGCTPTYQKTDAGSVFFCSNGPPTHRPAGSMCPTERGPGISDVGAACSVSAVLIPGCTRDSDCTAGTNGRCLKFGGPACNIHCSYDECSSDSDCPANTPCACRPSISDTAPNSCATESNCRIDADCGPGGFCSPSLLNNFCQCISASFCAPNESGCSETGPDGVTRQVPCLCGGQCGHGYFCHTPKDGCLDDNDCASGSTCNFDSTSQAWLCTACSPPL